MNLLTNAWLTQLDTYDKLFVGFSGGLDSSVLLHALKKIPSLQKKLTAVHVHHGLSPYADDWEFHCETFCRSLNIPFLTHQVVLDKKSNIEERARIARYQIFSSLLEKNHGLLLGHHANDQAETLLLHLLRGTGVDGLAAMPEIKPLGKGIILRPFLSKTRAELEQYAVSHQLSWIEDESNQNLNFSRNYLRHTILPLLQEKWPNAVANINSCAQHCQQAQVNLNALAKLDADVQQKDLQLTHLKNYPIERLVNILRSWLRFNQVKLPSQKILNHLIDDVIFAKEDANPAISWNNITVQRYQNNLYLTVDTKKQPHFLDISWTTFPQTIFLNDNLTYIEAVVSMEGVHIPPESQIEIRFRKGGESLQLNGHTKALKKLFQEWKIPPWERDTLPLLYINNCLAAVLGFVVSDPHKARGENVYQVRVVGSSCL